MKTFITIHFMTFIFQGIGEVTVGKCPDRYVDLDVGCYYFSDQSNITWVQAYFICHTELHGYLVEIENDQEQNAIRQHIETTADPEGKYAYWVGATDLLKKGEYRWMDSGHLLTYTAWYPKQPDNLNGTEDCVMLWKSNDYKWNDLACDELKLYPMKAICETGPNE